MNEQEIARRALQRSGGKPSAELIAFCQQHGVTVRLAGARLQEPVIARDPDSLPLDELRQIIGNAPVLIVLPVVADE